jgi:hypothetical protein
MDDKERNQFVDSLLDASLARYSTVAPRPGIEGRVLANVGARQERRSWFAWAGRLAAWAFTIFIAVGVLKLLQVRRSPSPPLSVAKVKTAPPTPPAAHDPIAVPRERARALLPASKRRAPQANIVLAHAENKLPMFPSPGPMTDQEKLLAQYVRTTPAEVLLAASTESAQIPELEMKPLEIAPLDTDGTEPELNH